MRFIYFLLLLYCCGLTVSAQAARLALVIGNNAYQGGYHLNKKPINDAKEMTKLLKQVGFKVYPFYDLNREAFQSEIQRFGKRLSKDDQVVVYYSGHGSQYQQHNYLIPVGAINEVGVPTHLQYKAVSVDYLLDTLEYYSPAVNIVILDACRDNPFKSLFRSKNDSKTLVRNKDALNGLHAQPAPSGTLLAYATEENKQALAGRGSLPLS